MESLFLSEVVVSKLLLGCSGHFLFYLCHSNPIAHSLTCMIHVQIQRTAWNVAFHMKQIVGEITVEERFWMNLDILCRCRSLVMVDRTELLHVNRAREPHLIQIPHMAHTISQRKWSKFHLKIPARESQHCLQSICHKYIHIMAWKDQKRKQKATCGNFVSPQRLLWAGCCWDDQGISCSFCAIAIQQHTV